MHRCDVGDLAAGCSGDPEEEAKSKLVGAWQAEFKVAGGQSFKIDFEFNDHGSLKWDTPFAPTIGTWKLKSADDETATLEIVFKMPTRVRGSGKDAGKVLKKKTETWEATVTFSPTTK